MRYRLALAAIGAVVATAAGSATAAGEPGGPPPGGPQGPPAKRTLVTTLDGIYQRTDTAGNPIGPPQYFHESKGPPDFADEQAAKGVGKTEDADPVRSLSGRSRVAENWGSPSYSGCAWYHGVLTGKDITTLFVVYKYHVKRNWCWNYGHRVTSASTTTPWFTNVDPNMYIRSVSISPHGWFYTWCCGDGRSGHYAFRQGQIENCILKYGCLSTWYPTIEIFVHGNGTLYIRRSGT
jgi:hypothetical protein